jgi:hypothetical protein
LKIKSHTKLKIIGPKVSNAWITKQMLSQAFNDLISPMTCEGLNVFTQFNEHVHEEWKLSNIDALHCPWFSPSNVNAKPSKYAMHKSK